MLKTGFLLTILAFVVSDVMGAGPYSPPETWECDSPGTDGLFITDDAIKFGDAAAACAKHNGVLADITNQNFLLATDMVLNCVGENQNAWIRSWDYNPINPQVRHRLALYVGSFGPGGGINSADNDGTIYALCMDTTRKYPPGVHGHGYGSYIPPTVNESISSIQIPQYSSLSNGNAIQYINNPSSHASNPAYATQSYQYYNTFTDFPQSNFIFPGFSHSSSDSSVVPTSTP